MRCKSDSDTAFDKMATGTMKELVLTKAIIIKNGCNTVAIEISVVHFWSETILQKSYLKLNSHCALIQFRNHLCDYRPNCTPLSLISMIINKLL